MIWGGGGLTSYKKAPQYANSSSDSLQPHMKHIQNSGFPLAHRLGSHQFRVDKSKLYWNFYRTLEMQSVSWYLLIKITLTVGLLISIVVLFGKIGMSLVCFQQ